MARRKRFQILFAPETIDHLSAIETKHHRVIESAIAQQLTFSPNVVTRNRKPLRLPAPFGATWELRCGAQNCFRVFYSPDAVSRVVAIHAIGVKEGNRLIVGGEEIEL